MKKMTRIFLALPFAALVMGTSALIAWPDTTDAADTTLPEPIAALADQGLDVVEKFDIPSGLTGYAATSPGPASRDLSDQ